MPRTSCSSCAQREPVRGAGSGATASTRRARRDRCARRTPDAGHRTPDTGHRTPDTGHRTPDTGHRTPDTGHRTGGPTVTGAALWDEFVAFAGKDAAQLAAAIA